MNGWINEHASGWTIGSVTSTKDHWPSNAVMQSALWNTGRTVSTPNSYHPCFSSHMKNASKSPDTHPSQPLQEAT